MFTDIGSLRMLLASAYHIVEIQPTFLKLLKENCSWHESKILTCTTQTCFCQKFLFVTTRLKSIEYAIRLNLIQTQVKHFQWTRDPSVVIKMANKGSKWKYTVGTKTFMSEFAILRDFRFHCELDVVMI